MPTKKPKTIPFPTIKAGSKVITNTTLRKAGFKIPRVLAPQTEADLEGWFCKRCPFPAIKFGGQGERGKSDRIILIRGGRPLFVEFKKPGEVLEPLQAEWHKQAKKLGYEIRTIDSKDRALRTLEQLKTGKWFT